MGAGHQGIRGNGELTMANDDRLIYDALALPNEALEHGGIEFLRAGNPLQALATLAYDAVALAGQLARLKPGGDFSAEAIANPNGWAGVDGVFRFLPDGRSERALAVIEIQGERNAVVSPAPTSFVGTN